MLEPVDSNGHQGGLWAASRWSPGLGPRLLSPTRLTPAGATAGWGPLSKARAPALSCHDAPAVTPPLWACVLCEPPAQPASVQASHWGSAGSRSCRLESSRPRRSPLLPRGPSRSPARRERSPAPGPQGPPALAQGKTSAFPEGLLLATPAALGPSQRSGHWSCREAAAGEARLGEDCGSHDRAPPQEQVWRAPGDRALARSLLAAARLRRGVCLRGEPEAFPSALSPTAVSPLPSWGAVWAPSPSVSPLTCTQAPSLPACVLVRRRARASGCQPLPRGPSHTQPLAVISSPAASLQPGPPEVCPLRGSRPRPPPLSLRPSDW